MGISVTVGLLRNRVSDVAWSRIYADTLVVLRCWPDPPLGLGYREVAGTRVLAHTRDYEREGGWTIVGDANSRRAAESFELSTTLHAWKSTIERETASIADLTPDALQVLAEQDEGKAGGISYLWGHKTQAQPYHALIVAVATLIENRLPGVALAWGDFHTEEADGACRELNRIFGQRFERPVLLEPARIHQRVPNLDAVALSKRHTHHIVPEVADFLRYFCQSQRTRLAEDLEVNALICTDFGQLCEGAQMAFAILGIRVAGLAALRLPLPTGDDREQTTLRGIAEGTKRQNIALTDMAWDSIESADDETLEFLYRLCQFECGSLKMHQTLLAVYENPVVRDHVVASWRNELRCPRGFPPEIASFMSSGRTYH